MKHDPSAILDAAVHAIDAHGVDVSMSAVARGAGVSNGTLFHYFPTKQALLDRVYLHVKTDLAQAILPDPFDTTGDLEGALRTLWLRWVAWGLEHPAAQRVTRLLRDAHLVGAATQAQAEEALAAPREALATAHRAGVFIDLPPDYIETLLIAQIEHAIAYELPLARAEAAFEVAWRGVTHP